MFRTMVNFVLVYSLAMIACHLIFRLIRRGRGVEKGGGEPAKPPALVRWLRIAINIAGAVSLVLVVCSGFSPVFDGKENAMTGDRLMWHVTTAPAFAICAVVVALFWAHKNRFGSGISAGYATTLRKLFFWTAVAFTIPTILSAIGAMYPIVGSDEQEGLFTVHRYCALIVAGSGLLFSYFALATWWERSED